MATQAGFALRQSLIRQGGGDRCDTQAQGEEAQVGNLHGFPFPRAVIPVENVSTITCNPMVGLTVVLRASFMAEGVMQCGSWQLAS
jgi:hypothetical protein